MEIKGIHEIYKLHATNSTPLSAHRGEEAASVKSKDEYMGQDVVSISPAASFRTALQTEVKKYSEAGKAHDAAPAQKIASLKVKYQGDTCPVTGAEIAASIMDRICGSPYSV